MKIAEEKTGMRRGIDYIGVGVCAVLHDGAGNILLMKRGPEARDERGTWDICGGAVEFGEQLKDALIREVQEEVCATPQEIRFLSAYDAHRVIDGVDTHWVQIVHFVKIDPNEVQIGEPHKIAEIGWFTKDNLPEPRHSQFDKNWAALLKNNLV